MIKEKFLKFLTDSGSQKEISFIVAEHENELSHIERWLNDKGYCRFNDVTELLAMTKHHKKLFLIIGEQNAKNSYDFAMQYPTGQIEIYDTKKMKSLSEPIEYKNRSMVFLTTQHQLSKLEKENLGFLPIVGITFRTGGDHA